MTRLRVAIIGGGPSGSTLALLLARQGGDVALFDDGRHPELLVGESMVPAVVPILRRLGLEQETASFSRVKPGVTFVWSQTDRVSVTFNRFAPAVFPYAYNIPRPQFDKALFSKAIASGVRHVPVRARVEPLTTEGPGPELALAPETLAAAPEWNGQQPHLIVDATGRARYVARVLAIPARLGPRKDVAHFAHFESFRWHEEPGQVLISRCEAGGWSWCIPLQERLSVGIVLDPDDAARLGRTPEERLERAIKTDPWLTPVVGGGKRVTEVATYANYQLISERKYGRGWVMVGDACGFIDPMLSPGVFLALRSAELLADGLAPWVKRGTAPSPAEMDSVLASYTRDQSEMLVRLARARRVSLRWTARGADPGRARLDGGESGLHQAGDAGSHLAPRRLAGQRRGDDVALQPRPAALPGPPRPARRRPRATRHPLARPARRRPSPVPAGLAGCSKGSRCEAAPPVCTRGVLSVR